MTKFEYIIVTIGNYTQAQLNEFESHCSNLFDYARYNKDKTKYLLKLPLNKPTPESFTPLTRYNSDEILTLLSDSEWQSVDSSFSDISITDIDAADAARTPDGE